MSEEDPFLKKIRIDCNDILGRHTLAALDIKAGENILLEPPLIICAHNEEKRCANCYIKLSDDDGFCERCHVFPLCTHCTDHNELNCEILTQSLNQIDVELLQKHPRALGVLQCLLLATNPTTSDKYAQLLQLEAHQEKRRNTDIWKEHQTNIVMPILEAHVQESLGNVTILNEELLHRICGILDVNCFEIRAPDEGAMRALFARGSLLPHDCMPNCALAVDDRQQLKMYAKRDISKNTLVSIAYTSTLLGTAERKEILRSGKYFECSCERCLDPTELGSHMSSLLCVACMNQKREGYVVWQSTITPPKWQCQECAHTLARENVEKLVERAKEEMFHARDDIYHYEMLLARLSRFFHANHYVLIDLKQNIASILRSIIENSAQPPGRKVFERKVRLCQEVLNCLRIIEPGISRLRAIAMYELSSSYAELCRLRFNGGEITELQLLEQLQRVEVSYRESVRMLLYEPVESPEGRMAHNMLQEIKELQGECKQLQPKTEEDI